MITFYIVFLKVFIYYCVILYGKSIVFCIIFTVLSEKSSQCIIDIFINCIDNLKIYSLWEI